jgi:hypothetical protein
MPNAQGAHEFLRPQPRSRPRQGVDLSLKLGVAGGKNKRTGNADKPQPQGLQLDFGGAPP